MTELSTVPSPVSTVDDVIPCPDCRRAVPLRDWAHHRTHVCWADSIERWTEDYCRHDHTWSDADSHHHYLRGSQEFEDLVERARAFPRDQVLAVVEAALKGRYPTHVQAGLCQGFMGALDRAAGR